MDSISGNFSAKVGVKIRFYRKQKGISLDQLASCIHKTKGTLSKYENGQIAVDVDTLYDIAEALDVELFHFMDMPIRKSSSEHIPGNPFSGKDTLYMYYYDGRLKRTVKTLFTLSHNQAEGNQIPCCCYMDCPDMEAYDQCRFFYTGTITHFEMFSYITIKNQYNPMEQIEFCILNPFHENRNSWGLMLAISYSPITPFGLKVLLSDEELSGEDITADKLAFSKGELQSIKKLNVMLLDTKI